MRVGVAAGQREQRIDCDLSHRWQVMHEVVVIEQVALVVKPHHIPCVMGI